jgi:acyl-CoA thioesterase FadM
VHDVIARGSSVVVLVNYGSMAKVQVPPSVRAALEVLGAPPR